MLVIFALYYVLPLNWKLLRARLHVSEFPVPHTILGTEILQVFIRWMVECAFAIVLKVVRSKHSCECLMGEFGLRC